MERRASSAPGLLLKDEVFAIIGAAIEVHRVLGSVFLEAVYQEALEFELTSRSVPFTSQALLSILYKEQALQSR